VFVFSYEHPLSLCIGPAGAEAGQPTVVEPYFSERSIQIERDGEPIVVYQRTVGDVFAALGRAGFRIEAIIEPRPKQGPVPTTIVWRARKEGV
jgi:hypothetical protein